MRIGKPALAVVLALATFQTACSSAPGEDPSAPVEPPPPTSTPDITSGAPRLVSPVDTNDVSILFPLPTNGDVGGLLQPKTEGAFGPLLPESFYAAAAPRGRFDERAAEGAVPALVAVRVDPCYPATPTAGPCDSEVRGVFQLVRSTPDGVTAEDGAIHVTYGVSPDEIVAFVAELASAKRASGYGVSESLGPHPVLAREGLDGPFARALRASLLARVGAARIRRVTSYHHERGDEHDAWVFSSFERTTSGGLGLAKIPGTESFEQRVEGSPATAPLGTSFARVTSGRDRFADLLRADRRAATFEASRSAFDEALAHEDPSLHSARTTDCAGCHLAEGAHRVAVSELGLVAPRAVAASAPRRDERTSVTNVHAFGYLGRAVAISQRTANESASVAALLNRPRLSAF
ncbi:MAG: hypothetical protein U0183_10910 [Polyangiaceae bacterium]